MGFHRVGIAAADCQRRYDAYLAWLRGGLHGDLAYLSDPPLVAARQDSERIAADARSIICVALAYDHRDPPAPDDEIRGRVARYARGRDYHQVLRRRLGILADELAELSAQPFATRAVTDTAPLLERAIAERAGLGFVGKNTMLITPGLGSYTVLGELLTTAEIAPTEPQRTTHRCGECRACIDVCPTDAFPAPFVLDARRCISHLTIENRGSIPKSLRKPIGNWVVGCDLCQEVCPYNAAAPARHAPDADLSPASASAGRPLLRELAAIRSSGWKRLTDGSAIRRVTRVGLLRNTAIALGNSRRVAAIEPLAGLLKSKSEMVREHAAWALLEIARSSRGALPSSAIEIRDYRDDDWSALCEVHDLARVLELEASGLLLAFLTLVETAEPEGLFSGIVRVATDDDRQVGFVAVESSEVTWLYVDPRVHRRGVGRALLDDALGRIDGSAEINVLAENAAAIGLYRRAGFEIAETRPGRLIGNEEFPAVGVRMVREAT